MDLVVLCFLSWFCTPSAAPPRSLGRAGDLPTGTQVNGDLPSQARSCVEDEAQRGPPRSASDLKGNTSQAAWRKGSSPSPADSQAARDFTLVLVALSVAAFAFRIYCCFHRNCRLWILSRLPLTWQGWTDNRRPLPRTSSVNSLQRCGAFAPRTSQSFPVAESSCNVRFVPCALQGEAWVHFRRPGVPRVGSASLFAAAPGNGAACGPTSETILEMGDDP